MKATNQGFVDLHTPAGFFLIGSAFLVISLIIIIGALYGRKVADRDKELRRQLREKVEMEQAERAREHADPG